MSSNWELQLISKILEEKDLDTAERVFQLDGSCFISDEAGILFRELSTYARDRRHYGDVPPLSWLMERYPTVRLPRPEASLRELCVYVRSDFTRRKLMTLSDDLMDIATRADDPQEAVDFLMRESKAMTRLMLPGEDMDFGSSAFDAIRQEVEQLETSLGLIGHPFPWEVLNKATQGLENGCLYFLYARPKSMKTWVMLHIAANLYVNYGLRVLIWCREMRPSQMRRRLAMLIGGIDYQAFRGGNLTDEEKQRLFDNLEMLKEEEHAGKKQRLFITKGSHTTSEGSETSMMELRAKAEDLEPQIIFADSPYHMQASTKWQDIGSLARNLKELAVDLNVPVFCTWQANRSGEKTNGRTMDEIALGDALGQEADGMFRLLLRGTKEHPLLSLVVPGAREFSFDGFTMHGRPAYDFSFYSDKVLWEQEDKAPDSIRAPRRDRTVVKQQALTGMKEIDYGDG